MIIVVYEEREMPTKINKNLYLNKMSIKKDNLMWVCWKVVRWSEKVSSYAKKSRNFTQTNANITTTNQLL